jgi:hypothetical protein
MPGLSDSQRAIILTLIDTAPDSALHSLDLALSAETRTDGPMAEIRDLVAMEASERRARDAVFSAFAALCPPGATVYPRKTFPPGVLRKIWAALKGFAPEDTARAAAETRDWTPEQPLPVLFTRLVAVAAAGLREPAGTPFAAAAILLDEHEPGGAELFASYLDLDLIARDAILRLPDWLGRMTAERAAAVRLTFRDATDLAKDATPRLMEILISQMREPWQILRLVSAVMDRPQDSFMASSELAHIGVRMIDQMEAQVEILKAFDPMGGTKAGAAAAEAVRLIIAQAVEFEESLDLKRDGPWGARIVQIKKVTAQRVEALLAKADAAAGEALPLKAAKFGKSTRGLPRFDNAPKSDAVARAEAFMVFIERVRGPSQAGGFAAARTKVVEKLDDRLDQYVEDVLDYLRGEGAEQAENARAHLDLAARLVGLLRDEKAAQIVRRRAAA